MNTNIRLTYTLIIATISTSLTPLAFAGNGAGKPSRHVERPAAQAGVASSFSRFGITKTFPAGVNSIEFDYYIDCESGDVLEVFAIGYSNTALWAMSGLSRGGRKVLTFTLAASTAITVRFQYRKDADAVHEGSDTAWIDHVVLRGANGRIMHADTFDDEQLAAVPSDWSGSGSPGIGGFRVSAPAIARSAARPASQGHASTSSMERTIFFPSTTGGIDFDYFVDSEQNRDYLELLIDGVSRDIDPDISGVQGISGLNRTGHVSVPVSTSGNHLVRFQYRKNGSVSAGLDTARVDRIRARFGAAFVEELHDFTARVNSAGLIRHENGGPTEWTGNFVIERATPHRAYVPPQTPLAKWAPDWATFSEPVLDGVVGGDWKNPVQLHLRNYGNTSASSKDGRIRILSSLGGAGTTLYVGLRVQASTFASGGENGRLRIFLDAAHRATLTGLGTCHAGPSLPGSNDRLIDLTYSFSGPVTYTPPQLRGNCSQATPWVALSGTLVPWDIVVSMSEPASDPGYVHIEVEIVLPSAVAAEELVGVGLIRENIGGTAARERLPYLDDNVGPVESETRSWETVRLAYVKGRGERSEDVWDAGAFPRVSRPMIHW